MLFTHLYQVRGYHPFPIDMLRYDESFPATEKDTTALSALAHAFPTTAGPTTIMLASTRSQTRWEPTRERWASFGWQVTTPSHPPITSQPRPL